MLLLFLFRFLFSLRSKPFSSFLGVFLRAVYSFNEISTLFRNDSSVCVEIAANEEKIKREREREKLLLLFTGEKMSVSVKNSVGFLRVRLVGLIFDPKAN